MDELTSKNIYPDNLNYIVTEEIGGFKKGDSLKGMDIAKILEKICCYAPITTEIKYLNYLNIPALWNSGYTGKNIKIGFFGSGLANNNTIANMKKIFDGEKKIEINVNENTNIHDIGVLSNLASKKYGIAYDSEIFIGDMKISDGVIATEEIFTERFKNVIDWLIEQNIDMICSSTNFTKVNTLVFNEYMEKLISKNILFITAMGNNRGNNNVKDNISFYNVITVGAVNEKKEAADFQSIGEFMTFTSYGVDVPGYTVNLNEILNTGTSFATPYVAGIIACLLQQGKERNLNLSFRQVREILAENCENLGVTGKDEKYGYGLVKGTFLPEIIKSDFELMEYEKKIIAKINYSLPDILYIGQSYKLNLYITPSIINYRKITVENADSLVTINSKNNDFEIVPMKEGTTIINVKLETGENIRIEKTINQTISGTIEECKRTYGIDKLQDKGIKGKGIKIAFCCSGAEISQYTTNIKGGKKFSANYDDIYKEGSRYKDATACISVLNYLIPEAEVYILKVKNEWGGLTNETIENSVYEYILNNNFDIVVWDYILQSYDSTTKTNYLDRIDKANIIQVRNSFISLNASKTMNRDDFIGIQAIGATVVNHKNAIVCEYSNKIPYYDGVNGAFNLGVTKPVVGNPWVTLATIALYKEQDKTINTLRMKELLIKNAEKLPGQVAFNGTYKNGLVKANII